MKSNFKRNRFRLLFEEELYNLENDILKVNFPTLTVGTVEVSSINGLYIKQTGDSIDLDPLVITIRVTEDMDNIIKFIEWLFTLKNPIDGTSTEKSMQATLQLYSVDGKVIREFDFYDLRPSVIAGLDLETNTADTEYDEASITFEFNRMAIKA
jgi:hypothetical protein